MCSILTNADLHCPTLSLSCKWNNAFFHQSLENTIYILEKISDVVYSKTLKVKKTSGVLFIFV